MPKVSKTSPCDLIIRKQKKKVQFQLAKALEMGISARKGLQTAMQQKRALENQMKTPTSTKALEEMNAEIAVLKQWEQQVMDHLNRNYYQVGVEDDEESESTETECDE